MEQQQKQIMSKLNENINRSGKIALGLFEELKKNKFNPLNVYLRVNAWDRFDMMVTVPESDVLKDEFLEMYDKISKIEDDCQEDLYEIFISFCYVNEYFDEQLVSSDGYYLKLK